MILVFVYLATNKVSIIHWNNILFIIEVNGASKKMIIVFKMFEYNHLIGRRKSCSYFLRKAAAKMEIKHI